MRFLLCDSIIGLLGDSMDDLSMNGSGNRKVGDKRSEREGQDGHIDQLLRDFGVNLGLKHYCV